MRRWLAVLWMVTGCVAPDPEGAPSPCAEAAAHVAGCLGTTLEVQIPCSAEDADALRGASCETVRAAFNDPKADGLSRLASVACRWGFFAACELPGCPDIDQTAISNCADWLAFSDCRACEYYRCREETLGCGAEGYPISYGGRYCDRFAQITEPRVSPAAAAWLMRVRGCLVDYFDREIGDELSCDEVWTQATDSHPQCYIETGFCELSVADWAGVVYSVDAADMPLRVVLRTAHDCLRSWLDG